VGLWAAANLPAAALAAGAALFYIFVYVRKLEANAGRRAESSAPFLVLAEPAVKVVVARQTFV